MRILHTADWHIGKTLYGRKRYDEFEAFLHWLASTIEEKQIDMLIVAGDVFDTTAPSNRSQQLYYSFLRIVADSCCRHIVITGGNHDSPSFLNAPRELLKALDVHVVGSFTENISDEILVLRKSGGAPELIVCAVPYLRDKDLRTAEPGETIEDKQRKLLEGIRAHYENVAAAAEQQLSQLGCSVPVVATGHLFTAGGETVDGDGVRELYVGSLAHVDSSIFSPLFTYVALGHLHVPQMVDKQPTIRYSGSPIPMGFGEAKQRKSVCLVQITATAVAVDTIEVPVFQKLEQIQGDWIAIQGRIDELHRQQSNAWLEVVYDGDEIVGNLRERLEEITRETNLEVLRVKNVRVYNKIIERKHEDEVLDDLTVYQVFDRCLDASNVAPERRPRLIDSYKEIVSMLNEDDINAE